MPETRVSFPQLREFITRSMTQLGLPPADAASVGALMAEGKYMVIDHNRASIELFNIGVVLRRTEHARNHAALFGHAHALGSTRRLDYRKFLLAAQSSVLVEHLTPILRGGRLRVV